MSDIFNFSIIIILISGEWRSITRESSRHKRTNKDPKSCRTKDFPLGVAERKRVSNYSLLSLVPKLPSQELLDLSDQHGELDERQEKAYGGEEGDGVL